jgi:hypothetical protein
MAGDENSNEGVSAMAEKVQRFEPRASKAYKV